MKVYSKEIKKELSLFDEYHKIILFFIKLISILKIKLFIVKNILNIKKIILFKFIIQKMILIRTYEDGISKNNQHKNNKFFNN